MTQVFPHKLTAAAIIYTNHTVVGSFVLGGRGTHKALPPPPRNYWQLAVFEEGGIILLSHVTRVAWLYNEF